MIETAGFDFARPRLDIAACESVRLFRAAQMMRQRAATAGAFGDDDFNAKTCEKAHSCGVDPRVEHGLGAAIEQGHAQPSQATGGKNLRTINLRWRR